MNPIDKKAVADCKTQGIIANKQSANQSDAVRKTAHVQVVADHDSDNQSLEEMTRWEDDGGQNVGSKYEWLSEENRKAK